MKRSRPKSTPAAKTAHPKSKTDTLSLDPLSSEEQALWRHVATSIKPIKAKARITPVDRSDSDDNTTEALVPPRRPARSKSASAQSAAPATVPQVATVRPGKTPPLADFDPRKAKKIGAGRAGIDARLDLHGMRQDEALAYLRSFLRDAHARGLKTVLVITGKGRKHDDPATPSINTLDRYPRGVLRRNVPRWLDEPDMRAIVVSYTSAAQRHGGDGAYYVELRRRQR